MTSLELKLPPPVIFLGIALLMWLADIAWPSLALTFPGHRLIAVILIIIGLVVAGLAVMAFHKADTTVHPLHPEKAAHLVSGGVYRLSRNPMYLGLLLLLAAWAIWLAQAAAFLGLPLFIWIINKVQIQPEERAMAAKFGADYRRYCESVRRWL